MTTTSIAVLIIPNVSRHFDLVFYYVWPRSLVTGAIAGIAINQHYFPDNIWGGVSIILVSALVSLGVSTISWILYVVGEVIMKWRNAPVYSPGWPDGGAAEIIVGGIAGGISPKSTLEDVSLGETVGAAIIVGAISGLFLAIAFLLY
jgi:hypothetical protein